MLPVLGRAVRGIFSAVICEFPTAAGGRGAAPVPRTRGAPWVWRLPVLLALALVPACEGCKERAPANPPEASVPRSQEEDGHTFPASLDTLR
jgi:hypothetical protein